MHERDRTSAPLVCGDPSQIAGVGDTRPWQTPVWNSWCAHKRLHETYRCVAKIYNGILRELRTATPSVQTFWKFKRCRAWTVKQSEADVRRVFREHPQTTVLTCKIAGGAELNDICIRVKFPRREPLAIVHADVEANPANYSRSTYKPLEEVRSHLVPLHAGMHVFLTRNVRKDIDFVNGMHVVVESWNPQNMFCQSCHIDEQKYRRVA